MAEKKDQKRDEKALVAELFDEVRNVQPPEDDPHFIINEQTLRRYLVARNWNVDHAARALKATIEWRRETRPQNILCAYCQKTPGFHSFRQVGFDRQRRPVLYSSFSQNASQTHGVDESLQHMLFLLENAVRVMDNDVHQIVWVLDCTGMKITSCNPRMGITVEKIVSNHYPERLGALICVNHGAIFQILWRAMKVFVHPDTIKKAHIETNKQKIEEAFTSLFDDDLKKWLYEEIRLNKVSPLSEAQREFWKKNNTDHDPRGCETYVSKYVENFCLEENAKNPFIYRPHSTIVQELMCRKGGCLQNGEG